MQIKFLTPLAVHVRQQENLGDRPWLKDVLIPQEPVAPGAARFSVETTGGRLRALTIGGDLIFEEKHPAQLGIRRRTPFLDLDIPKTALQFGLRRVDDGIRLALSIAPSEVFYGWGERFEAFARTRGTLNFRTRDAVSLIQGQGHSYSAVPFFLSSQGYGLLLLNSHAARWQIAPERGELIIEADGPGADYVLIYGPAFKDILATYTALTGRPPLVPLWAFGLWVTGYPQEDQTAVLALAQQHRQRNLPLDAIILDYHWEDAFHNFRWRTALFPEPDQLIASLKSIGVRLGLIITPFLTAKRRPFQKWLLNALAHNLPPGQEHTDERALPEFEDARSKGLLAHANARWWFGAGGMPDFANPAAALWWNEKLKPLYDQGVAFFKNDDGEYLPEDAHSAIGMDGREYHNLYGFYYGRAMYKGGSPPSPTPSPETGEGVMPGKLNVLGGETAQNIQFSGFLPPSLPAFRGEKGGRGDERGYLSAPNETGERACPLSPVARPLIYARSVWAGSQRFPALFLGDQKPTYECIRRTLRAGLNLGLAGFAYWGADVFGLDGKTTPELHRRHAQWTLLNPIARYFIRPTHVDDTRFPWSHGPENEANFRKYVELRYRLLPYWYALAWEAYQTGLPILRPLVLEFQDDPRLAQIDDQIMLGRSLMLAPIIEPGAVGRMVTLPEGIWHNFWTDETYEGPGSVEIAAPPDQMPILVRGGTLLPLGPALSHIPDGHRFEQIELHLWPPFPAEFTLYEDDGRTTAYQRGDHALTRIQAEARPNKLAIRISPPQGGFDDQLPDRRWKFVGHGVKLRPKTYTCPVQADMELILGILP